MDIKSSTQIGQTPTCMTTDNSNYSVNEKELELPLLIEQLRKLIQKDNKNLPPNLRSDDEFLSIFIRVREYNVERAFIGFKKTYKYMYHNRDLFEGLRPITLNSTFKQQIMYTLKSVHPSTQSLIGIAHAGSWDATTTPLKIALAATSFIGQESITRESTQIYGLQVILDMDGLSWSHMKELMNPIELKRIVNGLQGGFPVRTIGLHIINYPSVFWVWYSVIIRLLSTKIRQRIHLHENLDSLHKHFHPNILPQELGGDLTKNEAIDHSIIENILNRNEYFEKYYFEDNTSLESNSS